MKRILVAYDGTLNSKTALSYGIQKARERGGTVTVMNVFDPTRFIDYAHFKAEEVARAENARFVKDAEDIIRNEASGVHVRIIREEGNPKEELLRYAGEHGIELILAPPALRGLAKNSPCAFAVVPGFILFPVDNKELPASTIEKVIKEGKATGSEIILLGIIPEHIYSRWEKEELDRIKKETVTILNKTKNVLSREGLPVKEMMRSGYPDEEIMDVAADFPITMIIIPARHEEPSELNKAAAIILDEQERAKRPVMLVHANAG